MTEVLATTPGLYPLPDWAKEELAELKGHQKDDLISGDESAEITGTYDRVRDELVDWQIEAGLDRIVEGQARWDDMLAHPLSVHENVETRGIVRYYDNNNFYREPVVRGELSPNGDVATELSASDATQAILPGPYSLSELATDEHYGDDAAFLEAITEFLAAAVDSFPPVETLFLLEPSLVTDAPGDGEDERASEAIDTVAAATDAEVVVHTYWGSIPEKPYAHLMDADVDAIGFDFVTDHEGSVYNIQEYGTKDDIALGVVDGQNTLVETPGEIADRVEWVRDQVPVESFDTVYVSSNTELFYLPANKARTKLGALAEGAEEVSL
ncbi:methionine synthase [Natronomonas sp. F2-12]|jgi:5-methyltetrahydropteroyltriglutamate--homocysteine methyltransferase|uniref:Methionine synthase n=1 Tax=Natronomonas aquatica TaxID=2841590 RepID=A0A9R1D5X4_9EURY|nr:methionine synthase [Natronomonas aquatica]MCQ4333596.1 methionine synthase [Natronomonas aquatica]